MQSASSCGAALVKRGCWFYALSRYFRCYSHGKGTFTLIFRDRWLLRSFLNWSQTQTLKRTEIMPRSQKRVLDQCSLHVVFFYETMFSWILSFCHGKNLQRELINSRMNEVTNKLKVKAILLNLRSDLDNLRKKCMEHHFEYKRLFEVLKLC